MDKYLQANIVKGHVLGVHVTLYVRSSPSGSDVNTVNTFVPIESVVDITVESEEDRLKRMCIILIAL